MMAYILATHAKEYSPFILTIIQIIWNKKVIEFGNRDRQLY